MGREVYVDSRGIAHDDEGNTWPASGWREGSYFGRDAGSISQQNRGRGRGMTFSTRNPTEKDAEREKAIAFAISKKDSNFLKSIQLQIKSGRRLSSKQADVVRDILKKLGEPDMAALFEGVGESMGELIVRLESRVADYVS